MKARDGRGVTALLAATHGNHVEVARLLIAAGADVNAKDNIEDTPFLYAGAEGRNEILKMTLAAGADLKSINRYGGTALIPAAHHGHPETVKILLGDRDRQGSRQQARLDRLARGRDSGRRRQDPYRNRPPPGGGRGQSEYRRPRRRDAARACEKARLHGHGPHLEKAGAK